MAEASWYYSQDGRQIGPVTLDYLRELVRAGQLRAQDLVWAEGMSEWTAAASVRELAEAGLSDVGLAYDVTHAAGGAAHSQAAQPLGYGGYAQGYYAQATPQFNYAGFWNRFAAALLDWLIIGLPFTLLGVLIDFASGKYDDLAAPRDPTFALLSLFVTLSSLVVGWLYYALQESSERMATIGKRALGLRVTDLYGNRISFGRATGRHFAEILSGLICAIGYIMAGFTERKQALHDMIASTLVVKD